MAEKKLSYKEVPAALGYVVKTIWQLSPSYVITMVLMQIKDRLVPYVSIFIAAAVTSRLPALINNPRDYMGILILVSVGVGIELASRLADVATQNHRIKSEARVTIAMREYFYRQYAALPYYRYEEKSVIDAFNFADEFMYRFSQFGLYQMARTFGIAIDLVVSFVALVAVAWFLPILLLLFVPLLVRTVLRINREQAQTYHENRPQSRRVWAIEAAFYPRRIKETRLYGVIDYFLKERRRLSETIKRRELEVEVRQNKMRFVQEWQIQLIGLFATGIALWRIAYRGAPLGTFVLAQQLTSRAGGAVQNLFEEISRFDQDLYGFAEYKYITETLQVHEGGTLTLPIDAKPDISLRDISFTYPEGKSPVLSKLSLDIPYGTSLAIVGENGAGKTTLTKLILGLYQPESGRMLVNGSTMAEYDGADWLRHISVLLQDFGINEDITLRESVRIGDITKPKDEGLIWHALEQAEMKETIQALPHKLDTYLGKWIDEEKGTELSGGQMQRLAIARALYRDSSILILDEPTSSVDANAEERIFGRLREVRKGKTTVFISHRFSTVRRAERIVFMEKGTIIESGSHDELMVLDGKYAAMFRAQAKGYQ